MSILNEIIQYKRKETEERKKLYPVDLLKRSIYYKAPCISLKQYILRPDKNGIIAEFKRKSPSRGIINERAEVEKTSIGYMQGGASALSVLTDEKFFGGKSNDLITARKFNYCPILRKDFIIDTYQIEEAKSIGADAILLIASVLTKKEINSFTEKAHSLGMEVLLEFYSADELDKYSETIDLAGINNRNLKNFNVDFDNAANMVQMLPENTVKVAESGITKPEDILTLKEKGFDGFLIGETFMKSINPENACRRFIQDLKKISTEKLYSK